MEALGQLMMFNFYNNSFQSNSKTIYFVIDEHPLNLHISGTNTTLLGEGGQSQVYKCSTNAPDFDPQVTALKMYRRPWEVCRN